MATVKTFCVQGGCSGQLRHHTSYERWLESLAIHNRFLASVWWYFLRDIGRQTYILPYTHIINCDVQVFSFHCEVVSCQSQPSYWLTVALPLRVVQSRIGITWELVSSVESGSFPPPTTDQIKICILTRSPVGCCAY